MEREKMREGKRELKTVVRVPRRKSRSLWCDEPKYTKIPFGEGH